MLRLSKLVLIIIYLTTLVISVYSLDNNGTINKKIASHTENTTDYYLPNDVIPNKYIIHIKPFLVQNNFTYNGKVNIIATVNKNTSKIVLHANQINIQHVSVLKINETLNSTIRLDVKNVRRNEKYQFLNITLTSPVNVSTTIEIKITFSGILGLDQAGFFRRSYKFNNETRWIMGSHMEATQARKAFPCFDEPALKAVFHISVDVPENYFAISNMPVKSSKNGLHVFEPTPQMPTYLVTLIVCDFRYMPKKDSQHYYRTLSNPKFTHFTRYALSVISTAIDFFEGRLDVFYELPKLDVIIMPGYQTSMENWGAIMYPENLAIYDFGSGVSSLVDELNVRNALTNKIALMWFGNRVTAKHWDYIWLSKAFGSYFGYHAHENAIASWNLESQFVVDVMQPSFLADALPSSKALTHKVYSPDEIAGILNTKIYDKAAGIIRMVEKLVGTNIFYQALNRYLLSNYSAVVPEILFTSFEEEFKFNNYKFNQSFTRFMSNWTTQAGFPVVHAYFTNDTIKLKQERFYLKSSDNIADQTWIIPITMTSHDNPNFDDNSKVNWMTKKEELIPMKNASSDWVILNIQQAGYYRVNYDEKMWRNIIRLLKSEKYAVIHPINRASLVDDILNLARAGLIKYDLALTAMQYLTRETKYIPWKAALEGFNYLRTRFLDNNEIDKCFKVYLLSLLQPTYDQLGFYDVDKENRHVKQFRILVSQWMCSLDYKYCVNNATYAFKMMKLYESYETPANQRSIIYCTAIKHGTTEDWNYLWNKYQKSQHLIEKMNILSALACSKNSTDLERLLLNAITPELGIESYDVEKVISYVISASNTGALITMKFIRNNYEKILNITSDVNVIINSINQIARRLSTSNHVIQFEALTLEYGKVLEPIFKTLQGAYTDLLSEIDWYNRNSRNIQKWLKSHYSC